MSEQPDAAAASPEAKAVAAPAVAAAVAAPLHKSRHTMTKYLQIARRASEKPPLSIQIYFRSFLRWFVRYDSFGFGFQGIQHYYIVCLRCAGSQLRLSPCNLLCGSANNCLFSLSLLLALHLLFLLLFVVHKMRRLVANSPGADDADDDDGVAAAGRLRFAFNIQIVTLTSEIYYCSPISFSRWAGLSCG